MLKLKLQYFGHLMWRVDSLEKILILGGIGGRRRRDDRGLDGWIALPTRWMWVWVNSGSWWWTGRPGVLWFTGLQRVRRDWPTELNWTELFLCSFEIVLVFIFYCSIYQWLILIIIMLILIILNSFTHCLRTLCYSSISSLLDFELLLPCILLLHMI